MGDGIYCFDLPRMAPEQSRLTITIDDKTRLDFFVTDKDMKELELVYA